MNHTSTRLSLRPTWRQVEVSARHPVNIDPSSLPVRTIIAQQLLALLRADGGETNAENLISRTRSVLHRRRICTYLLVFFAMQCVFAAILVIWLDSYGTTVLAAKICGIVAAGALIYMPLNHMLCARHSVKLWESDQHHPTDTHAETSEAFLRFAYAPLLIDALDKRDIPADGIFAIKTQCDLRVAVAQLHMACAKDVQANWEDRRIKVLKMNALLHWIDVSVMLGIFSVPRDGKTAPEIVHRLYENARRRGTAAYQVQTEKHRNITKAGGTTRLIRA